MFREQLRLIRIARMQNIKEFLHDRAMIQCVQCRQWFHERCLEPRPMSMPIMFGDTYFMFMCKVCNYGEECFCRLYKYLSWTDLVHLILFNLSVKTKRQFHSLGMEIMPYVEDQWKVFQPRLEWIRMSPGLRKAKIWRALHQNPVRFCQDDKKWGLLKFLAPPQPQISLKQYSDTVMVDRIITIHCAISRIVVKPTKFLFNQQEMIPPYPATSSNQGAKFKIVKLANHKNSCVSSRAVRKFCSSQNFHLAIPRNRGTNKWYHTDPYKMESNHNQENGTVEVHQTKPVLDVFIPRLTSYDGASNPFGLHITDNNFLGNEVGLKPRKFGK